MGAKSSMMVLLSKQCKGPEEVVNGGRSSTEVRELYRSRGQGKESFSASCPAHSAPQEEVQKEQSSTPPETGWKN